MEALYAESWSRQSWLALLSHLNLAYLQIEAKLNVSYFLYLPVIKKTELKFSQSGAANKLI
jgi:hypothetical protein